MDSLAAYEAELSKLVDEIAHAQPEIIRDTSTQWHNIAKKCEDQCREINDEVQTLKKTCSGKSVDAFADYMAELHKAGDSLSEALRNAGDALIRAADDLATAKTAVYNQYDHLHIAIKKVDDSSTLNPDQAKAAKESLYKQAIADINKYIANIRQKLNDALVIFKGSVYLSWKFSAMPKPASLAVIQQIENQRSIFGGHTIKYDVGPSGLPFNVGTSTPQGQVKEWIEEAIKILQANGIDTSKLSENDIWAIIQHESGGNPNAINLWDSNAKAGHPSKGLMQCIDSTFQTYKLSGHDDIYNPVDNIIAGVRYSIARYGSVSNVPGIRSMSHGGAYQGY